MQTRKRPLKKDGKYIAKIESQLRRLEAKFAEGAPDAFADFKSEEKKSSGEATRHKPSRSRKIDPNSDQSSVAVAPTAFLLADDMGIVGYLGMISI